MSAGSAIPVPDSFVALYLKPGRSKPTAPWDYIAERHEFCDDLAQLLTDRARHTQWDLGLDESTVLERMHTALASDAQPVVSVTEAQWVVCRLAELLGWPLPDCKQPQHTDVPRQRADSQRRHR
jgi:hypothetical protein